MLLRNGDEMSVFSGTDDSKFVNAYVKLYQNDDLKPTPTYISPCMFLVTKAESTLS